MRRGVFRPSQDSSWATQFCICIDESSLCRNEKQCDKPSHFAASLKTVYAPKPPPPFLSPFCNSFLFSENEANRVGSTFCLRNTDVKEPLVWTVIPLLKPWAELSPDTPDAITFTPPHPHPPRSPRMCGFVSSTTLRRTQKGQNGAELRFPEVARTLHADFYPEFHATPRAQGFWKPLVKGKGGGHCGRHEAGSTEGDSLSVKCLSATCNLKDCSTDALYLCINYAKWPNQLPFSSSAWRARLRMHRLIPSPFSREERPPPTPLVLVPLFFPRRGKTKRRGSEHSISVRFVSFDPVRRHKRVFLEFRKITGAFLTLADL